MQKNIDSRSALGPQFEAALHLYATNPKQSVIDIGNVAAEIRTTDILIQTATCGPLAAEWLTLIKASSAAFADGANLVATGVKATNGSGSALLDQGNQRITDAGAIQKRANDILNTVLKR